MRTWERSYQATRNAGHQPDGRPKLSLFLKLTLTVLLCSSVLWGWRKLSDPQTLPIEAVKITGNYVHVDKATLQKAILPFAHDGLLGVDVADLKNSLMQLPWIANVSVRKVWPGGLVIELTEQTAAAKWNDNELLNPQGGLFNAGSATDIPSNLPALTGPVGQQNLVWTTYQQMNQSLAPLGLTLVKLDVSSRQAWYAELNNGMTLVLGRNDALERLQRFIQIYPKVFGNHGNEVGYVDLRYINGMAVHWKANQKIG